MGAVSAPSGDTEVSRPARSGTRTSRSTAMSFDDPLTMCEVQTVLAEEVQAAGGTVTDVFDDGLRLFARSVLPAVAEVRPGDRVQGGVAVRACEGQVWVHPYVFRQVCRNGA